MPGFTTPDPLAEKHYSESPYSYCGGDPVNRMDPSGLDWFVSTDNQYFICLTQSDIIKLKIIGNCYNNDDGRTYCNKGSTYSFTVNNISYVGAQDCYVYRATDYYAVINNPEVNNAPLRSLTTDSNASKLGITANTSLLTGIPYWIAHDGVPIPIENPLTELPIPDPKTYMINIEPLPGIDLETSTMPLTGAYLNGLSDGVSSVGSMILHPVNTLNGMGNALQHPVDTYFAFNNLVNDYVGAIKNGDGQKVAYYTFNFLGVLAGGEVAGGVASRLSQAGGTAFMARHVTTSDGFLFGSIGFKTSVDLKVGLYK